MTLDARLVRRLGTLALDVDIRVAPGEVVALLGPNGAGKTTVLRCLAGLLDLDGGTIRLAGRTLDDAAGGEFVAPEHRSVGMVFQDYLLFEHLTVLENVAFGRRARGEARRVALEHAQRWLDRVGLGDRAAARPRELSGGQRQRVALARALATEPDLLLLDEPLAALDAGTRATIRRDLRHHLDDYGGCCVLVTHDPVDAYTLADRVVVVEDGRVLQEGSFAAVAARPRSRYVAELVGVNLFRGDVIGGVLVTGDGACVVAADAPDGPALAMIRPTAVSITREAPVGTSARNVWAGVVADLDRLGDRVRLRIEGELPLVAEVTIAAREALELRPGDQVFSAVKATEVETYPA